MSWFRHLTIGQKFLISFGTVLTLLTLSLAAILYYLSLINSYVERHKRITVPAIMTAADMRQQVFELYLLLRTLLEQKAGDPDEAVRLLNLMASTIRKDLEFYRTTHAARTHPVLFSMLEEHRQTVLADQEDLAIEQIAALMNEFASYWTERTDRPQPDRSALTIARADSLFRKVMETVAALMEVHSKIDAEMKAEGDLLLHQARLVILVLIILLGVLIVAAYIAVSRQIVHPLRTLAQTADRVAHHDLSASFFPWSAQDEVGDLARSLASMLANLRERTAALERKTKELESFTYTVAHDLKAPLREIEGFSSLLEQKLNGATEPTAKHYLAMIRASALRMVALIEGLLRYSRLEQQHLPKVSVNLRSLVEQVVADRLTGESDPPPRVTIALPFTEVWGEPISIGQALGNLVGNALKFSRGCDPREISIGGKLGEGERILWIRDTGIGFEPSKADTIFGLFERLHGSGEYEGTGVGLAIVKLVMEKHGGRAWGESAPGKGSTFYLAFPDPPEGMAASREV